MVPEEVNPPNERYDPGMLERLLPVYYKHLFPITPYFKWLNYQNKNDSLSKREFSFTIKNDIYIRYKSFSNEIELKNELMKTNPQKIDIGAIYNLPPKDHKRYAAGKFKPLSKELVFDIDMTDYDEVRNCCQEAAICMKCWTLMKIAIKILDGSLREDFGFRNILWIYSGRRGVHCWVSDHIARQLPQQARTAIVDYLTVLKSGQMEKKVKLKNPIHPFIDRCINVTMKYWPSYLEEQKLFCNKKSQKAALHMIPNLDFRRICESIFTDLNLTSTEKFEKIIPEFKKLMKSNTVPSSDRFTIREILLEFCLPRLDANVSKGVNHLLKSPFSIHPKTGRVCVPIDPENVDEFDPFEVPTINQICAEVQKLIKSNEVPTQDENGDTSLYMMTSMGKYMMTFEKFVKQLIVDEQQAQKLNENKSVSPFDF